MVSYNNSNVVQCLRQYDMFANSLDLVKTREEKNMIIKQLTKLENKIIDLTNEIYEEEYYVLANKECGLIDEEQNRLNMLIDLINQRLSYVEKRCNNHYKLTGDSIDVNDVLGASTLENLEERIKIIVKYSKNVKLEKELKVEVESLTKKIMLASEKIEINKSLNHELEKSFCDVLSRGFEKCGYYELFDYKDDIEYAYYETEKSLTLAELNLETAKTSPINVLDECQNMLDEIRKDYIKYKEKLSILRLMDIFNKEVTSYEELLSKRKNVNELFRNIKNEEFLDIVISTVNEQYNTILMEQQDINTYNDLTSEKDRKLEALLEIEEENNSDRFKEILEQLIKNEEAKQERLLEEQKKIEEEEKKKKLELERKKQEEILKRQKIIEDARKKEMEKRTKELLEQQQKSVLQVKKRDSSVNFNMINEISNRYDDKKEDIEEKREIITSKDEEHYEKKDEEIVVFRDKIDIEKELFDEFNNDVSVNEVISDSEHNSENKDVSDNEHNSENKDVSDNEIKFYENMNLDFNVDIEEDDKKLPDVSIDEYMKNFDEKKFNENDINSLFNDDDDDFFPNIPI